MANYDLDYEGSEVQDILDTGKSLEDDGYIYLGTATPSTIPGTPTERVAYVGGPGTYNNFGTTVVVPSGSIVVITYSGSAWSKTVINASLPVSTTLGSDNTTIPTSKAVKDVTDAINTKLGEGYVYAGIATATTNPGTPTGKVFYLAKDAGTYTNFGGLTLTEGVNILKYNGTAWSQEQLISIADIYKNPLIGYYECDTAGGTAAKTVAATGYVLPTTGGSVKIKMANRNTVSNATLNINSTGAKPLFYNGVRAGVGNTWDTNEIVEVFYDGTNYQAYNVAGSNGDGVFDISAYNLTDGQPTPYVDLAAALGTNGEHVPQSLRKGGMSVKFIQGNAPSSDNNYVQYRLMSTSFSTTESDWQGVDDEPTAGSNNLVKSGGVEKELRPLFSNMIDLGVTAIILSGNRLVDITLSPAYQTAANAKTLIFVDRPELVQDVRVFRADLTYVLTNITDYVTGNILSESNEEWTMIRVVLTSNVAVDTPIRLNFCDAAKVSIPANYFKLKGLPDIDAAITKLNKETTTLYNNNYCYVRIGATATLNVSGTTATLSAGTANLVLVYQTNQVVALSAGNSVSFTISRGGVLYYLVYSLGNNQFAIRQYHQMQAENNELILGSLITSPANYADAIFDYYGLFGIVVNGSMSYGNRLTSLLAAESNKIQSKLGLAKVIPIVKDNRLEIFRNSISTEVHKIYDLQAIAPASDGYGRFRENGYIYEPNNNASQFDITFNLVDYMGEHKVSSVKTTIIPVSKKSAPASNKNILVIGDSYTYINTWVKELSRRLKGTGGTPAADGLANLTFIGTVLNPEVESPVPSEGHSSQTYSYFIGSQSPFYYNGSIDISSYVSTHGYGSIDYVIILLGCNGGSVADAQTLIQAFISYNPNIKIMVGSNAMKYNQWGWSSVGLAAGMKSSVWRDWYNWNASLEKLIEDEFSDNVFYVEIPAQIDIDNNFQFTEGAANNRNSEVQIRYGVNNVHPAESAYYQIADAFYNAFHYWCLS